MRVGLAAVALAGSAIVTPIPATRAQESRWTFPIRLHVARASPGATAAVVPDAWLAEQIATANRLFAPYSVGFVVLERRPLPEAHAELETRRDRHALGARLDRTRIDVFVVRSLRDVDDPTQMRRGVHWRPAGRPGAHFVVISAISGPSVLAHELGHYFGNPHSSTPGNIMSYERSEVPPFFDAMQGRRIVRSARRFAREGAPAAVDRAAGSELPAESD